jgi:hypothetical protein
MNAKKILINITFMVLYYFGILLLSIIVFLLIIKLLDYESQRYIFEEILGGDVGIEGGYGIFFLWHLIFILAFIIFSILAFIILNIITKKYSYFKMIIITIVYCIICILLLFIFLHISFLYLVLLLPLLQIFLSKMKNNIRPHCT